MTDKPKADYYAGPQAGDFAGRASPSRCSRPGSPRPRRTSPTIPTPWRSPPSTPPACPTCAWCCSRASIRPRTMPAAASSSTPTSRAPRAASCSAPARRRSASTGSRCAGRCGCAAAVLGRQRCRGRRLFRQPRARQPPRRLGLAAVAPAGEPLCAGEGRRAGHGRYPIGEIPRPPYWSGFRITPSRWSSGTTARSACTSASPSAAQAPARPGAGSGSIPELAGTPRYAG